MKSFNKSNCFISFIHTLVEYLNHLKMRPTTSHRLRMITLSMTATPTGEQALWTKLKTNCVNLKIKYTRKQVALNMLRKLKSKNIGTNEIEYHIKKKTWWSDHWKTQERRNMLRTRINHATEEMSKLRYLHNKQLSYMRQRWGHNRFAFSNFLTVMQEEVRFVWLTGLEKMNQKIQHLSSKWSQPDKTPTDKTKSLVDGKFKDILISDEVLIAQYGQHKPELAVYGDVELSDAEKKIITLPPKYTTYEKIDKINLATAAEVMSAKIRWEMRSREEKDFEPWSEESEWKEVMKKTVHDQESCHMNFQKRRVTDLSRCRRLETPDELHNMPNVEIVLASVKSQLAQINEEYIAAECDQHGNIRDTNLTAEEKQGLKSLKNRIKANEIHVAPTDKSGKLSVNTRENYIASLKSHTASDIKISWEEKTAIENVLNAHGQQLARILMIGKKWKHEKRVNSAMVNQLSHIPSLYGLPKDHKPVQNSFGPKMRPVCGASEAPNSQLSEILSEIVVALAHDMDKEIETMCLSTEEMLSEIDALNQRNDIKNLVIMSTDVVNMFPSLPIDKIADIVATEFVKSSLEVEVDNRELGLYLAIQLSPEVISQHGLSDVIPRRKSTRGRKIGITTEEINNRCASTVSKFHDAHRNPTKAESKLMLALALAELIKTVMGNHVYCHDRDISKQAGGGSIGNSLTGALATIFMLWWSRLFKDKVKDATVNLPDFIMYFLKYYVDDGNLGSEALPPGSRLVDGVVEVVEEFIEEDENVPDDQRTAEIILQIANSVTDSIQLTIDFPSNNSSKWMPLLDLQVSVRNNTIDYKFYKKKMSNHQVMLSRSAMPGSIKINSLTQEVIRRLRNTRRCLDWSVKTEILSEFSHSLMSSGYPESFRLEVIQAGLKGFQAQCDRSDRGEVPLHRPRSFQRKERIKKKAITKTSWFRPYDSVIFVPSTPGAELASRYKRVLDHEFSRVNLRVKVVETAGVSLVQQLFKRDSTGCLVPECQLCVCDQPGASHTRAGAEYQGVCLHCAKNNVVTRYDGESGFNAAYRILQHKSDIEKNSQKWAFSKHLATDHPEHIGDVSSFSFRSVRTFKKPLDRQCFEGVMINRSDADIKLNGKAEFHQPSEVRVVMTRQTEERTRRTPAGS